jgi:nitrite reductase/ring-hydroxylating ferredoxin subunit
VLLKPEHYTQGDAFQAEKHYFFAKAWLPVGAAGQLAKPGDFVSANIGGWPLLAVHGADGVIRVLRNTCRHQKMLVTDQASGHCEHFRCRFHGWTYHLDGRFRDAPPTVGPADAASDDNHLLALNSVVRQGMVFARLDGADAPMEFAALAQDGYVCSITTEIGCNWKTLLEHCFEATPDIRWQPPLVLTHDVGGAQVIEQLMPRSFLRTRLISHVFGLDAGVAVKANADGIKAAAEALQARRVGGESAGNNTHTDTLHAELAVLYTLPLPAA